MPSRVAYPNFGSQWASLDSCEPLRFDQDDQDVSTPEMAYTLESNASMRSIGRIVG
jgi:hypothetical protein